MAEDKGWFERQAIRTAEDFKQLPEWLRTQRDDRNEPPNKQSAPAQVPAKVDRNFSA